MTRAHIIGLWLVIGFGTAALAELVYVAVRWFT